MCTPAKVFESAIYHSVYPHVSIKVLEVQHGFWADHCTANLRQLMTQLGQAVDTGVQVGVARIDLILEKPLTVDKDVLLMKLAQTDCTPQTLSFFANYMRNRRQVVDWSDHGTNPTSLSLE